jgi:hypothetical protein
MCGRQYPSLYAFVAGSADATQLADEVKTSGLGEAGGTPERRGHV